MKIFWWQAGLHVEPESREESTALAVLVDSLRIIDVNNGIVGGPTSAHLVNKDSVVGVHEPPEVIPYSD